MSDVILSGSGSMHLYNCNIKKHVSISDVYNLYTALRLSLCIPFC